MEGKQDLTLKALLLGLVLSVVMVAANTYLGLKVAMTISANIPCSVMALILFHTILKTRSIAEVNVAQATGSVGEGLAAGVVFVFPALVLTGAFIPFKQWGLTEYAVVTVSVLAGSVLGIVLTGFLRRPMVVESKELRYPEGVATAEILKTGMAAFGSGKREGILGIALAFFGGAAVKIFSSGAALFQETVSTAFKAGHAAFKIGADTSAALVGVGFIIEFNGAALVALGGALAWVVFIPTISILNPSAGSAAETAEQIWRQQVRFIGVGGMIAGGIWSIIQIRKQLIAGIKGALSGLAGGGEASREISARPVETGRDLGRGTIWSLIISGIVLACGVYFACVGFAGALIASVYTIAAVFFFVAISVYIVGLIGSTNQPVSGITICTFLLAALFLFAGRIGGEEAVKAVILISGVVCLAACLSGTAAQNFKTAMVVGGSPRALQTGLLAAAALTAFLAAPLMAFLDKALTIGSDKLPAPQASMFAALAKGLFVEGSTLPWDMVGAGVVLGIVLILIGLFLKRAGSSFGVSPMAVAVGVYLPFTTTLPILIGGLAHLAVVLTNREKEKLDAAIQTGTVLCAGLVAGEAITGIVTAVLMGLDYPLPYPLIASSGIRSALSAAVLVSLPVLIYFGINKK